MRNNTRIKKYGLIAAILLCVAFVCSGCEKETGIESEVIPLESLTDNIKTVAAGRELVAETSEEEVTQEPAEEVTTEETGSEEIAKEPEEETTEESEEFTEEIVDLRKDPPVFSVTDEERTFYKTWLDGNISNLVNNIQEAQYGFYDVDYDGVAELIVREPMYTYVLKKQNDSVVLMCDNTQYMTLLPNGMLMRFEFGVGKDSYEFYEVKDGKYELLYTLEREDKVPAEKSYDGVFGTEGDGFIINGINADLVKWNDAIWSWLPEYTERIEKEDSEYYELRYYCFAEVSYTSYTKEKPVLPYAVPEDAYQAFLKGECGAYFADKYADCASYATLPKEEGRCMYLYDIVNYVINSESGSYEGYDVSWSYIDCGRDGRKELLLRIDNIDRDHFATYVLIQYRDNQLYMCYSVDEWSRSRWAIDQYGCISSDGSGGAGYHVGEQCVLDASCELQVVYSWQVVSPGWSLDGDDEMLARIYEVQREWVSAHRETENLSSEETFGMLVRERFVIGDKIYYYFAVPEKYVDEMTSQQKENLESLKAAWAEAGVVLNTAEEVDAAMEARADELGTLHCDGQPVEDFTNLECEYYAE
ncbi:MAG: hypothetical protein J6A80_06385 [Lachnospiraceae bacterium]|nr:hypothetical protein [Lachnospiraceae bacterium]